MADMSPTEPNVITEQPTSTSPSAESEITEPSKKKKKRSSLSLDDGYCCSDPMQCDCWEDFCFGIGSESCAQLFVQCCHGLCESCGDCDCDCND